ncbi:MAG TPA: ATP-binding protein [Methanothrix sp.]|nr:ATP-binding protein [Methanothrix sp.]
MEILTWFGRIDLDSGAVLDLPVQNNAAVMLPSREEARAYPIPQPDLRAIARKAGLFSGDDEYNERLRAAAISLAKRKIEESATAEKDLLFAMEALDGMSQAINLLDERLYEWSRLHRQEIVHGRDLAEGLVNDDRMGQLAATILGLRASRKMLEAGVSSSVSSFAPNLSLLAGPVLAARLISRAGGLSRLASMPSSRVQIMGAEKSLFKHLAGAAPSPKHGIIYRHPAVIGSPRRLRGKVARALAAKLAIAARLDSFQAGLSPDLQASLEARLKDIKQRGRTKSKSKAGR